MANIKPPKFIDKIKKRLEDKIEKDNKDICKFFEDSFGKPPGDIILDPIEDTYLYNNPKITVNETTILTEWEDIKEYLSGIPEGTSCSSDDESADADIDYLHPKDPEDKVKNDFDLQAHVKTKFTFGSAGANPGIDPGGEGDMRHRRTCEWEPAG